MKSSEDIVKQKLEEAIVLARASGLGNNWFDIYLEDGTNIEITVSGGDSWQGSSYDC